MLAPRILRTITAISVFAVLAGTAHADEVTRNHAALDQRFGILIGAREWRTPNPAFVEGSGDPTAFVLRYRWGPHRQHVVGELLGTFEQSGETREELFWSLYAVRNPVTSQIVVSQIGVDGSLAEGTLRHLPSGGHALVQTLFAADGSTKSIRHEEHIAEDQQSFHSYVFERDERGTWQPVREWRWEREH